MTAKYFNYDQTSDVFFHTKILKLMEIAVGAFTFHTNEKKKQLNCLKRFLNGILMRLFCIQFTKYPTL